MITVTASSSAPPAVHGLVRDLRVRWALEEAGIGYRVQLAAADERGAAAYRQRQPFGQVPAFEEDGLVLFESGAIVLHVGERSELLLPVEPRARARAVSWVLAALNSVEPPIQQLTRIDLFHASEDWAKARRPEAEALVRRRLGELAAWLGSREHLEDRFTAGDLMMATVLQFIRHTDLVTSDAVLGPYLARLEARPAYQRALAGQLADLAST